MYLLVWFLYHAIETIRTIFHVALAKGKKISTIAIFMKIRAAEISQELENRVQYL